MKIKDAQQGPDLFTAYMEHLNRWMPIDGIWQTAWGNHDGPQGLKRGDWDNLFDSEVTPVLEGYQPAAGPHGQWHVAGSGKCPRTLYQTLWRRLMVPVRHAKIDQHLSEQE
jgi:hypothetical protein